MKFLLIEGPAGWWKISFGNQTKLNLDSNSRYLIGSSFCIRFHHRIYRIMGLTNKEGRGKPPRLFSPAGFSWWTIGAALLAANISAEHFIASKWAQAGRGWFGDSGL